MPTSSSESSEPLEPTGLNPCPATRKPKRAVVGLVLYDETIFDLANLKPSDFYLQDLGWIWQAYGAVRAKAIISTMAARKGNWSRKGPSTTRPPGIALVHYYYAEAQKLNGWFRKIREWVERRRMLAEFAEQTKNA